MFKRILLSIFFIQILSLSCFVFGQDKIERKYGTESQDEIVKTAPFRYVIVAGVSRLEKHINRDPENSLYLEVIMEDSAFNEKNLKTLFKLLDKRFNKTNSLYIEVYTSLGAILTPEENDRLDLKGSIDDVEKKYKIAKYFRLKDKDKSFTYSIPGMDGKEVLIEQANNN
ncbi:MAG: hypothetical protein M3405_03585 [Acidobacteriota bacterium]|nr:hypothetical protein [Acidobacteriota bacterium]